MIITSQEQTQYIKQLLESLLNVVPVQEVDTDQLEEVVLEVLQLHRRAEHREVHQM